MPAIGDVHAFEVGDGRWGALWITRVAKTEVSVEVLDWVGDAVPSLEGVGNPGPIRGERPWSEGRTAHASVGRGSVPRHFPHLGNLPRGKAEKPPSQAQWDLLPQEVLRELRWRESSQGARDHFRSCAGNREATVEVAPLGEVSIQGRELRLDLRAQDAPFDWSRLDRLGALLTLAVTGPAPGLARYLAGRELIRHLRWRDPGPGDLDLRDAGLEELDLAFGDGAKRTIHLGPELDQLRVQPEDSRDLRFVHPDDGHGVTLRVEGCRAAHPGVIPGLERLTGLAVATPAVLEVERLRGYRELRSFQARLDSGAIVDAGAMAAWEGLRVLQLEDAFEMNARELPTLEAWPELDTVRLDGLRKTDATLLRKRWKGVPELVLRNTRSQAWVRAHGRAPRA